LWPIFAVMGQTGMVISERINQLDRAGAEFDSFAASEVSLPDHYNAPALTQVVMLLVPSKAGSGAGRSVGTTCRVCPQQSCGARREPSIMNAGV
jgi:hypothetical protein